MKAVIVHWLGAEAEGPNLGPFYTTRFPDLGRQTHMENDLCIYTITDATVFEDPSTLEPVFTSLWF